MLALAPMRKNKGQSISLFVFALITVMILNIGLALYFGIGAFFDERAEANHSAHFSGIYYSGFDSVEQGQSFMENDARVAEMERINAIGGMGEYLSHDVNTTGFLMLSHYDRAQKIDAPSFIGEHLPLDTDGIYIPNTLFLTGGYEIGDAFKLFLSGNELNFTIAGGTEEITFGTAEASIFRFYISDEKYAELRTRFTDNELTLLLARLDTRENLASFRSDYQSEVPQDGIFRTFSYDDAKQARTMIPVIIASISVAFAFILVAVNLIVIHFNIINSIEEGMTNIGALKAVGYRSAEIIASNVMQFGLVALVGGAFGIILAGASFPMIVKIFEPSFALVWNPGFDANAAGFSILLVLATAMLIAFLALRRVNKLLPLTALRGGTVNRSFKKNVFPLNKSRGPLNLLLAFKQIVQNKKQTAAISIIVAVITMASVACIAVNDNISFRREAFTNAAFGELAINDVIFTLKNGEDGEAFQERLLAYPEVRKVIAANMTVMSIIPFTVDEVSTDAYIVEDCSLMESDMLIDGNYPVEVNEIVFGVSTARETGKNIGDTVRVRIGDLEKDYIVTGIFQCIQTNGRDGLLTAAGIRSVMPDFQSTEFIVYVKDGVNVKDFAERVQSTNEGIFDSILLTQEYIGNILDNMSGVFIAIATGVLAVTVFVVILTLYMVVKTTILRKRRELGIQKAVGFTTWQLMNQIALNMTPVILLGVFVGAVAGCFVFNPLLVALMSGMGIAKINFPAPLDQIIVVCIAIVILAYAISMLIAWRIRKISAYALVSE